MATSTPQSNVSVNEDSQSLNSNTNPFHYKNRRLVFFSQILIISVVIFAAIINLSIANTAHTDLWIALLATCIGAVIPGPRLKNYKNNIQLSESSVHDRG